VIFGVTLRIIWHNFLRVIWHIDAYLNATFGPGVFDQLRSLFRRLGIGSDSRCFVIKDATRLAPKELIHRHANPARMINLRSKGLLGHRFHGEFASVIGLTSRNGK
jgi:hypothetical protein